VLVGACPALPSVNAGSGDYTNSEKVTAPWADWDLNTLAAASHGKELDGDIDSQSIIFTRNALGSASTGARVMAIALQLTAGAITWQGSPKSQ
jgi:hypothetical protein